MRFYKKISFCLALLLALSFGGAADAARKGGAHQTINPNKIPEWKTLSADTGGTLLFSDSPEVVKADGILYEDTVKDRARLLYYHLNGAKDDKKVVVLLENMSDEDAGITVHNFAYGAPSDDFLFVGKAVQEEYFAHKNYDYVKLPAKSKRLLSAKLDQMRIKQGQLVYGVVDFTAPVKTKVTVMMLPFQDDAVHYSRLLKQLAPDKDINARLRGTFTGMDRVIKGVKPYNGRRDGVVGVTLADDVIDRYRTGIDASDGDIVWNYGNYGILYKLRLPTEGSGRTSYYLNPRGGVYAGAVAVRRHGENGRPELVLTPSDKPFFGEGTRTTDLTYIGTYDNREEIWIEFSPPGASNLPARLILAPAN